MAENGRRVAGDLIIAADFGTSGVKVGLVDPDFRIVARTTISYPLSLPAPSQAEQNPQDWWTAFGAAIRQLSSQVANLPERAAGIVFAAQIGFIPNQAGSGIELKAIAANVLGGVSLLGGVGSAVGVFVAVIFLTAIDSALVFLRIPAFWNDFIAGAILLLVIFVDGRVRMAVNARIRAKRYASTHHAATPSTSTESPK